MGQSPLKYDVSCSCGASRLALAGEPRTRLVCHCRICQAFNHAPFADIGIFRREEAVLENEGAVEFLRLKSFMAVDRGRCRRCEEPVVEYLSLPGLPGIAFVPVALLDNAMDLPPPALHVFYHRRVQDVDTDVPCYSGFLASQLGAAKHLLPALRRRA